MPTLQRRIRSTKMTTTTAAAVAQAMKTSLKVTTI
jgi:hypothetical protein